jgi:lon-related putative ATP-dependent protease
MTTPPPLEPDRLRRRSTLGSVEFRTTDELEDLSEIPGQDRALDAVRLAVGVRRTGFNVFVLGPPGSGRETLVRGVLEPEAAGRGIPDDWCYVNNFADGSRPRALRLPAGRGRQLRDDVAQLVEELRVAIPAVFENDEFRSRVEEISTEFSEREEHALSSLAAEAAKDGVALLRTPNGFVLAPLHAGEAMGPEEFAKLPEAERERLSRVIADYQERLAKVLRQLPVWSRERRTRLKALARQYIMFAVGHAIDDLVERYRDLPDVLAHLEALRTDVVDNAEAFQHGTETPIEPTGLPFHTAPDFRRYQVNLVIDNAASTGAPVVYEDAPSYQNLIGRIEHLERFGALFTDFTLIRAGALHRANGGYLILDATKVLSQPFAWELLKRCLRSGEIRMESLGHMLSIVSTRSLEPQPIPLDVKIALIGDRLLYYLLVEYDPDFRELFKIAADFEDEIDRSPDAEVLYARLVATLARREKLLPLERDAVCRIIERAARLAEDAEKVSARLEQIADLLREADHWARSRGSTCIEAADVRKALAEQRRRAERLRLRMHEAILRNIVTIDTSGAEVGQVNGLSVYPVGEFTFAQPTRITATVRLGEGEVIDIEREAKLGGNVHSKAVMTLSAYLGARYASDMPLSLSASLVFEQTYGGVEGDSASAAELCALLSAIADAPLRQDLAITGSVDQLGRVQAIGGVNEKIEGFFDICQARGLTGEQGVIIPSANLPHLMLREEVVEACAAGRFRVFAVDHVDAALELLTGRPMGEPDAEGNLPEDCLDYLVLSRLAEFWSLRRQYATPIQMASTRTADVDGTTAPPPETPGAPPN